MLSQGHNKVNDANVLENAQVWRNTIFEYAQKDNDKWG